MRRLDPSGKALPPTAYVFGNEVGEEVKTIRVPWDLLVAKAGIADLHFHDLPREFGCRLLEAGASLSSVRDFLGHANVTTTNGYLSTSPIHLQDAMRKLEDSRRIRTPFAQNSDTEAATPLSPVSTMDPKSLN